MVTAYDVEQGSIHILWQEPIWADAEIVRAVRQAAQE